MNNEISVILPEIIPVLRDKKNQDVALDKEEYSIYYKNIIYPYREEYDIQTDCICGRNLGHCWRINQFPDDITEFDFTIKIFGDFGKLLAKKTCKIKLMEKKEHKQYNLLCIGDSMTRAEVYLQQAVNKARNIKTTGLRNIAFGVNHEGRGGWTSYAYLERFCDGGSGVSPFLFPKGYSADEYFGDKAYWEKIESDEYNTSYSYSGISPQRISDSMVCLDNGALYRYSGGEYTEIEKNPEFEFSFTKYIKRYNFQKPDIVSLLFGSNEFQPCSYEDFESEKERFIATINKMVTSIKEFDNAIKVIINLPVCGGDQYSWGNALGCKGNLKQYNYCIKMAAKALLEEFEKRKNEGIFICPMLAVCDSDSGFPGETVKSNIYSERNEIRCSNWVHPSEVGYKQMGDALAAAIIYVG